MSTRLKALIGGAFLGVALVAPPAMARDIAIDGDPSFEVAACSIGSACSGIALPFSIITPAVTTNQIFIYNSGIVSLGSALPLTAAYGDASSLGHAYLAPGFGDFGATTPTAYITNVQDGFDGFTAGFRVTWAFPGVDGAPIFQVEFIDLSVNFVSDGFGGSFQQDPTKIGDVLVNFAHGSTFENWNGLIVGTDPGLPNGSLIGWGVGALNSSTIYAGDAAALHAAAYSVNLTDAAAYVPGTPGIPEPATWMSMILGFAGLGAVLRRTRRRLSLAG